MFGTSKVTVRARRSRRSFSQPTASRAAASSAGVGRTFRLRANRHKPHVRTNRDIKRPVRELRDPLRPLEDIEQFRADGDRFAEGLIAQPQQLAVRLVVAHDVFERVNALEGGTGGGFRGFRVRGIKRDGEERAHRRVPEFEPVQGLLRRAVRQPARTSTAARSAGLEKACHLVSQKKERPATEAGHELQTAHSRWIRLWQPEPRAGS